MIKINCDLCGKINESLNRTLIENVELSVCNDCSKFGKVLAPIRNPIAKVQIKKTEEKDEKIELLVENYAEIIKKKRESMGLTQKEFAQRIYEKESTIHKIETGVFAPPLGLAKKLEKVLGLKLIEDHLEKPESFKIKKAVGFTLGDFINIRK